MSLYEGNSLSQYLKFVLLFIVLDLLFYTFFGILQNLNISGQAGISKCSRTRSIRVSLEYPDLTETGNSGLYLKVLDSRTF